METNELKVRAEVALKQFLEARNDAVAALIEIVKEHGNFIPLIPIKDNVEVCIFREKESFDCAVSETKSEVIFGLRYVEGEGLFVCTETCLENYEYDYGYNFFSFVEPDEGDIENMNKALEDLAYFENFDDDIFIKSTSLISILSAIQNYL